MKKIIYLSFIILVCLILTSCKQMSKVELHTSTKLNADMENRGTFVASTPTVITSSTRSPSDISNLEKTENEYIGNSDEPKIIARYGEELFKNNFIFDAATYLFKALSLGYKSEALESAKKMTAKGIKVGDPRILVKGWNPVISFDGKYIAYTSEEIVDNKNVLGMYSYDIQTKKQHNMFNLTTGRTTASWSNDNSKIAAINGKIMLIGDIQSGVTQSESISGLPDINSIVWSKNSEKLAFITQEKSKFNVYVYDILSRKVDYVCEGSQIISFENSEELLIELKGVVNKVVISNKSISRIGELPKNVLSSEWALNGESGIGYAQGKELEDRSFANSPTFFDLKSTKQIFDFSKSHTGDLITSKRGDLIGFSESTFFIKDSSFKVLWVATVDGQKYIPIDYGSIEIKPGAFSEDGSLIVYSKDPNDKNLTLSDNEIYLVSLKVQQ